ncbi:TatD family hydrolase [Acetobacteraceae bacterium KSS8]|uniref:TatD family hydrolase n=1 Tax=Endosaccharibacter trunci TaxID=2812733 RepID=A0ABT1W729_9PROT|nr:TatD family hydrolase [Acetobacteraceae bacterium KSS8]
MLIDSHCHLDHFRDDELDGLLDRAREAGLAGMVTIGTRLSRAPEQRALAARSRPEMRVWCTIGTHPDHVGEEALPGVDALVAMAQAPEVVGIGESGLDYFHGAPDVRPAQMESFRVHLAAARAADLPLVIHTRDADEDTEALLREEHARAPFRFLLHCFSSGETLARAAIELGGYVSFSGIITFPKSQALRDIAASLPEDRILVETDSPYLAPVPKRGKRNEPALVAHTAAVLAAARGLAPEALGELTTRNFHRLFSKTVPA